MGNKLSVLKDAVLRPSAMKKVMEKLRKGKTDDATNLVEKEMKTPMTTHVMSLDKFLQRVEDGMLLRTRIRQLALVSHGARIWVRGVVVSTVARYNPTTAVGAAQVCNALFYLLNRGLRALPNVFKGNKLEHPFAKDVHATHLRLMARTGADSWNRFEELDVPLSGSALNSVLKDYGVQFTANMEVTVTTQMTARVGALINRLVGGTSKQIRRRVRGLDKEHKDAWYEGWRTVKRLLLRPELPTATELASMAAWDGLLEIYVAARAELAPALVHLYPGEFKMVELDGGVLHQVEPPAARPLASVKKGQPRGASKRKTSTKPSKPNKKKKNVDGSASATTSNSKKRSWSWAWLVRRFLAEATTVWVAVSHALNALGQRATLSGNLKDGLGAGVRALATVDRLVAGKQQQQEQEEEEEEEQDVDELGGNDTVPVVAVGRKLFESFPVVKHVSPPPVRLTGAMIRILRGYQNRDRWFLDDDGRLTVTPGALSRATKAQLIPAITCHPDYDRLCEGLGLSLGPELFGSESWAKMLDAHKAKEGGRVLGASFLSDGVTAWLTMVDEPDARVCSTRVSLQDYGDGPDVADLADVIKAALNGADPASRAGQERLAALREQLPTRIYASDPGVVEVLFSVIGGKAGDWVIESGEGGFKFSPNELVSLRRVGQPHKHPIKKAAYCSRYSLKRSLCLLGVQDMAAQDIMAKSLCVIPLAAGSPAAASWDALNRAAHPDGNSPSSPSPHALNRAAHPDGDGPSSPQRFVSIAAAEALFGAALDKTRELGGGDAGPSSGGPTGGCADLFDAEFFLRFHFFSVVLPVSTALENPRLDLASKPARDVARADRARAIEESDLTETQLDAFKRTNLAYPLVFDGAELGYASPTWAARRLCRFRRREARDNDFIDFLLDEAAGVKNHGPTPATSRNLARNALRSEKARSRGRRGKGRGKGRRRRRRGRPPRLFPRRWTQRRWRDHRTLVAEAKEERRQQREEAVARREKAKTETLFLIGNAFSHTRAYRGHAPSPRSIRLRRLMVQRGLCVFTTPEYRSTKLSSNFHYPLRKYIGNDRSRTEAPIIKPADLGELTEIDACDCGLHQHNDSEGWIKDIYGNKFFTTSPIGLRLHRDHNAAVNILHTAIHLLFGIPLPNVFDPEKTGSAATRHRLAQSANSS